MSTVCSIEGCQKPARRRGMCPAHYTKFLKYGDPMGGPGRGSNKLDLTDLRFGLLTAVDRVESIRGRTRWQCRCDCGSVGVFWTGALTDGHAKSCGCTANERRAAAQRTHGQARQRGGAPATPEYRCWRGMIRRCTSPKEKSFRHYGARGITVCERWRNSFENFFADMGPKPSPKHSIERRDNDGNYEPNNCCWATQSDQVRNRRKLGGSDAC